MNTDNIDVRVTPALHPENIKQLDGWDEEVAPILSQTETAFSTAYEGLKAIHDAKAAAAKNPTLNDAARLIQVDDFAQKKLGAITRAFDAELSRLNKAVTSLEQELSQPVESKAAAGSIPAEVRAHLKQLPTGERMSAIRDAITSGDVVVATAALGAPAMLSGLDPKMQALLLREYHVKQNPTAAKRLKVMQGAKELIAQRGGLAMSVAMDAVGFITEPKSLRRIYASELRKARDAAEAPFRAVG
ncbi:hypothetical protein [Sphingosinicella sp. YJ22]|uniref:hypothetical protein n=1 Tax=Sphingosinicella sp. YJ22 TaxID=1104780 RepID=UPI00140884AB|nr:hypothetical protein [Sphingosinicella sp. YJ22]